MAPDRRMRHYGAFYGLERLPGPRSGRGSTGAARGTGGRRGEGRTEARTDGQADEHAPRVLVYGNCQAEALRVSLDTAGSVQSVRMPPVHELTLQDLPQLDRLLAWADVLVAQSVGEGYRGLPLGTGQVAARLRRGARVVRVPNYFCTALYPEQVLVRHEDPRVSDPPLVPYHDVRRLGKAGGWSGPAEVPATAVRAGAEASIAELARRESEQGSLVISDVVRSSGAEAGWTVDHPGNPVLLALAQRVLDEVGAGGTVRDPGRILLSEVMTPLRPEVLDALDHDPAAERTAWVVGGRQVSDEEVAAAHEEFYAAHPRVVEVGLEKKGAVLRRLGWRP
ncbi:WcbI family polysaccharide biosynthesis putative acetyltransferase [Ornithinimicrobium sufpigmenti]|uniref:WcbI family polysaccharide biosynthesis putative acetyltransferase n=1 Tax=Ornithinimicrobium sufpigmenti TaxID=2508882 RepID=UPI001035AC1C|nr:MULTISPECIES: WcbI family polysaccharide biosynthesis putative acetyltransferase [unclassified Ornithinimicrobium]